MRIAMIGPFGFHPNKTMRSRAWQLARCLVPRGHQVRIFMPPWHTPEEADRQWTEDGVAIRYLPLGGGPMGITARLVRETLAWRPDVVHAFKPKAYSGLAAWWLWRFQRRRLRLVVDTDDWEGRGGWNDRAPYSALQKRFFTWQERWGMTHCHILTAASRTLQSLAWAHGVAPERVVYLPNGPGIEVTAAPDPTARRAELGLTDRPTVLLYSRLFEFDTGRLVDVLARVRKAVPELAILVVGQSLYDDEAADFHDRAAAVELTDALVDVGWQGEEALPATLAAADVGLYLMDDTLLNRTKCPVKLADMAAVGLPVVAEAVGQVPEYVLHGQTGRLVASGDVSGLAAGLIALLENPRERQRLGEAAKTHQQTNFAWERLAETAEGAYRSQ